MDDFGKGHATYEQILNLPIDIVKIDGGVVRNCHADPIRSAIISSICDIAQQMNLKVVAECVETQEEYTHLNNASVNYFQGYLVHRPAPLTPVCLTV